MPEGAPELYNYNDYTEETGRSVVGTAAEINLKWYLATAPFAASRFLQGRSNYAGRLFTKSELPFGLGNFVHSWAPDNLEKDIKAAEKVSATGYRSSIGSNQSTFERMANRQFQSQTVRPAMKNFVNDSMFGADRLSGRMNLFTRVASGGILGAAVGGYSAGAFGMVAGALAGSAVGGMSSITGLAGGLIGYSLAKEMGFGTTTSVAAGLGLGIVLDRYGGLGPLMKKSKYEPVRNMGDRLTHSRYGSRAGLGGWLRDRVNSPDKILNKHYGRFVGQQMGIRDYSYWHDTNRPNYRRNIMGSAAVTFGAGEMGLISSGVREVFEDSLRRTEKARIFGITTGINRRQSYREFVSRMTRHLMSEMKELPHVVSGAQARSAAMADFEQRAAAPKTSVRGDFREQAFAARGYQPAPDSAAMGRYETARSAAMDLADKRGRTIRTTKWLRAAGWIGVASMVVDLGQAIISQDTHNALLKYVTGASALARRFVGQEFGSSMPITNMMPTTQRQRAFAAMERSTAAAMAIGNEALAIHG